MTNKKEKLLKETYDKFIQISLSNLSMEGMEEFVDQKVMGYGTTVDEKVLTIDGFRELVSRQREQGKDIKMIYETTPVILRMADDGNSALFVDEFVISIHLENNPIELFLRVSTFLEYRDEKWIIIHWHGSKPEYEEGETDTWHINEWKNKTEELERLVAEKTTDLESKNRELEIEASLERVRAVAMSMLKSDELMDVAIILHKEIKLLGFTDVRNTMFNIFNDEKEKFLNYDYSDYGISGINEVSYNSHPLNKEFVDKMRKVDKAFMMTELTGNDLDEWRKWRISEGQKPDSKLDKANSIYYYEYSIDKGAIGISTFEPITEEQLEILQKFRNVFNLAYQHFSDLKKAEEQAREAQIELSLERIRAQAMAMKESSDLLDIVVTMRSEFVALGHEAHYFWHMRWLPEIYEKAMTSGDGTRVGMVMDLPRGFHGNSAMIEWEKNDEPVAVFPYDADGAIDYVDRMIKTGDFHKIDHNAPGPDDIRAIGGITFVMARTTHGEIGYSLPGVVTDPPAEDLSTLARFAGAFDLAYRRFEDLKEAEAQTREAQIEAALERVRSKALAMHSSEDLALTIDHFFRELKNLNVKPIRCGVGIKDGSSRIVDVTVTSATENSGDIKLTGKLSLDGHPILDRVYDALQLQEEYFPILRGEEINEYYQAMNPEIEFPNFPKDDVQYGYYFHYKEGGIFAWTEKELLDEEINIFRRFKSVLSLTYRRYLDLKESEAQAKEAQIEAALERVRSKTMAMHKSNDLTSAVATLFEELVKLGLETIRLGIGIFNDKSRHVNAWAISSDNQNDSVQLSGDEILEGHPFLDGIYDAWKNQNDYSYLLQGEDLLNYYNVIAESNFPVNGPEGNYENAIQYYHCAMFSAGGLFAFQERDFTTNEKQLMRRFANVFHLTFIRHLDLKSAEAQNKIIQAENERKTEELEEARELQLSMLPKELPNLPNLDIAVYMQTATEVGGDYYDFHLEDDGTLTTVIGDATGHGMKAGTIVTITKSLFHSLASGKDILSSFSEISRVIKGMNFRQLSMCMIMLKIKDDKLSISSAAMPPVLIYRSSKKSVEEISFQGMPLGAMSNFPYQLKETNLQSGDTIFLFSDGLPELMNGKNEMYGYDRTKREFLSVGEKDAEEIVNHFKNSASDWVDGKDPDDDVTFVVIKVK